MSGKICCFESTKQDLEFKSEKLLRDFLATFPFTYKVTRRLAIASHKVTGARQNKNYRLLTSDSGCCKKSDWWEIIKEEKLQGQEKVHLMGWSFSSIFLCKIFWFGENCFPLTLKPLLCFNVTLLVENDKKKEVLPKFNLLFYNNLNVW